MGFIVGEEKAISRRVTIRELFPACRLGTLRFSCLGWLLYFMVFTALAARAQTIHVDITPEHSTNSFRPTEARGAGVDRISRAATDKLFTDAVLKQVL
jgi:hypothetical protein